VQVSLNYIKFLRKVQKREAVTVDLEKISQTASSSYLKLRWDSYFYKDGYELFENRENSHLGIKKEKILSVLRRDKNDNLKRERIKA
jgi:hypothetical protein